MKLVDFKKIISYFNFHTDEGTEIKVLRDWKVILCGFVFLLFIVLLINVYIFWKYQSGLDRKIKIHEEKIITVDKEILQRTQRIVEEIERKEKEFNENLIAPEIKDPSL